MNSLKKKLTATALFAVVALPFVGATPAHAAAPANNAFANPETLAASGSIVRSNVGANGQINEPAPVSGDPYATIWFKWTAPATETVTFDTVGSDVDTVLGVYSGTTITALNEEGSSDDESGCDATSLVQFDAVAGTAYRIQVGTWDDLDTSDNIHLTWNWARGAHAPNDNINNATTIPLGAQVVNGSTLNSTIEPNLSISENLGESSTWYKIPAAQPTAVDVSLTSSSVLNPFDLTPTVEAQVWGGANAGTASLLATVQADANNPITAHLTSPGTIWIRMSSPSLCDSGNFKLTLDSRTGVVVTTNYTASEFQSVSTFAARLGWTPEQLQHDSVLIWQFIYALAGITTPTPVPAPVAGTLPISSVFSPGDVNALNKLNTQWALSSTNTQRVASNVLMFVLGLGG